MTTVAITTKTVPSNGSVFPTLGSWRLVVKDSSGNAKAGQTKDSPIFDAIDTSTWADGTYTASVDRVVSAGPGVTPVNANFVVSHTMIVPDVITVTVV